MSLRLKDVNFSTNPTTLHIRKEFAKTGSARDVYISDEASNFLQKQWIDWKYRDRHSEHRYMKNRIKDDNDLIFAIIHAKHPSPRVLYFKILIEFQKVLNAAGFIARKEEGYFKRRKVSLHSFRRFVKSTISNQVGYEYSEWFLGHATKSTYYQLKEEQRREIYQEHLMKYFTYLDYSALEATGQNVKKQLLELSKENQQLRERDTSNTEAISKMQEQLTNLQEQQSRLQGMLLTSLGKLNTDEEARGQWEFHVKDLMEYGVIDENYGKAWLADQERRYGKLSERVKIMREKHKKETGKRLDQCLSLVYQKNMTTEQSQKAFYRLMDKCKQVKLSDGSTKKEIDASDSYKWLHDLHTDNIITEKQYSEWQKKLEKV